MAAQTTITIDKGDILGGALAAFPVTVMVLMILAVFMDAVILGNRTPLTGCAVALVVIVVLAVLTWVLWDLGHWFTR